MITETWYNSTNLVHLQQNDGCAIHLHAFQQCCYYHDHIYNLKYIPQIHHPVYIKILGGGTCLDQNTK